jgi:hypothetical protein
LCEQINRNQGEQKIRNKHRCSGVIFSHSLAKKERKDRNRGNERDVEGNG